MNGKGKGIRDLALISGAVYYFIFGLVGGSLDPRKFGETESFRIKKTLNHKLFVDPAYVDTDSNGEFSIEELGELYKRAGFGEIPLHPSASYVTGMSGHHIPSLSIPELRIAVESYEEGSKLETKADE